METLIQMLYRGSTFKLQNTWFSDTSKKFLQKIYNDLNNTVVPDFNIDNNTERNMENISMIFLIIFGLIYPKPNSYVIL